MTAFRRSAVIALLGVGLAANVPPRVGTEARVEAQLTAAAAQSRLAQTSGTLNVVGLREEVKVVRDRWGVPHIFAKSSDDLFFAQGFVQAQDRLFQMDLWRRGTQGYLAEILGEEYLERDRLSRLLRYRGDMEEEWTSYAPDGRRIIEQFVKGINAWVEIARKTPPIEFTIAGYGPATWEPRDVLSRAEAFVMSGNATSEVFRARLVNAVGAQRSAELLPPNPFTPIVPPNGLDLQVLDARLDQILRRIGSGASGFGQNLRLRTSSAEVADIDGGGADEGSNNWVINGSRSQTGRPILANDPHRALDHPALRYIVHLNAPGWNVIGSIQPWLPGVAFGHNDRVAWGATLFRADAQDLYVEKLNPSNRLEYEVNGKWVPMTTEREHITVRGRAEPVVVELQYTRHGPVVAIDEEKHLAFALRWTGAEPGTAGYLASIGISRARTFDEFRTSLARWKMPGENIVYADVDGNIGYQASALTPVRKTWSGLLPVPGWTGDYEWSGWYGLDDLPHDVNPKAGFFATANHNVLSPGEKRVINYEWSDPARINRIREVLASKQKFTVKDFEALQHDSVAWNAKQLVPLLSTIEIGVPETAKARDLLLAWDRNVSQDSSAAALFVVWEQKLRERLVSGKVGKDIEADYTGRAGQLVVPLMTSPTTEWFGPDPRSERDKVLVSALGAAIAELQTKVGADPSQWQWGKLHSATFRHPVAGDAATEKLLNIGPFPRAGYGGTPFATGGRGFDQNSGSSYRHIMDLADWDKSVATSAPGQSGQPGSPHFDDLAKLWAEHKYFPLPFSATAINESAGATLTLIPRP
jgi:penicillin G amidase